MLDAHAARRRRHVVSLLALALVCTAPRPARAQPATENETSFSVERFTPAPGAGAFFTVEDADVLAHLEWAATFAGSLMSRPIVLQSLTDGTKVSEPVRTRLGFELLGAIGLGRRYQVGLALPVIAAQDGDRLQGIDLDETALQPVALGDLRLHGKLRFAGKPGQLGLGIGVALAVSLPTGAEQHFAGEKGAVIEWKLVCSWAAPGWRVAGNLGPRFRTEEVVLLSPARPHGNELLAGVAGEVIVPFLATDQLSVLAEYTAIQGDSPSASSVRGPSPHEARFGARWRFRDGWSLAAGLGFGTTPNEVGSPEWRFVTMVRFDTAPPGDLDRDGVPDTEDQCRLRPEDRDGFYDHDGCPDPDNDGDQIPDVDDECPNDAEDYDHLQDLDGCPE